MFFPPLALSSFHFPSFTTFILKVSLPFLTLGHIEVSSIWAKSSLHYSGASSKSEVQDTDLRKKPLGLYRHSPGPPPVVLTELGYRLSATTLQLLLVSFDFFLWHFGSSVPCLTVNFLLLGETPMLKVVIELVVTELVVSFTQGKHFSFPT